jgi:hypothetical protein
MSWPAPKTLSCVEHMPMSSRVHKVLPVKLAFFESA